MTTILPERRALPVPLARRWRLIVLHAVVLAALLCVPAAPGSAARFSRTDLEAAEATIVAGVNASRAKLGLRQLRLDERVRDIARARSQDMADDGYFSHTAPDGTDAGDLMVAAGIKVYGFSEAIGWNSEDTLEEGVARMLAWWRRSSTHFNLMVSQRYNYVGVGVVAKPSRILYTIVFLRGPDRTPPRARLAEVVADPGGSVQPASESASRISVSWKGSDVPLQILTSGLRDFRVQHRPAGGTWASVMRWSTDRSRTLSLESGDHEFRVQSRDRAGNRSAWTLPASITIPEPPPPEDPEPPQDGS